MRSVRRVLLRLVRSVRRVLLRLVRSVRRVLLRLVRSVRRVFTEARADRKAIRDENSARFSLVRMLLLLRMGNVLLRMVRVIARVEGYLEGSRVSSKSFRPKVVPSEQEPHTDSGSELPAAEEA